MNNKMVNMGEGKVFSVLLKLGGPAMASMFFQNLYALVDTVFVSWLGTVELAALSLAVPFLYMSIALSKGVAVGSMTLMSHARGADNNSESGHIAKAAWPLSLLILCPFCLLALPAINQPLFGLFDIGADVLEQVNRFIFWLAWTFPVMGFTMICEGIFLSYGDAKTPMMAMIVGNILNIILDPFLIFTCKMGISGASLASLIGWAVSGAIMYYALKKHRLSTPSLSPSSHHTRLWKDIIQLGIPVALSMLVIPVALIGLNYILAPFGSAFVGAWNLSSRLEQMLVLPLYGLSCSLIPFTSFNMGRNQPARIHEAIKISLLANYVVLVPSVIILGIYAQTVIGFFKPSPEILALAPHAFRLAILGYIFVPFELTMVGLAQGIKQPKYTFIINTSRVLILRLPLALLCGHLLGGKGVYLSHPISLIITGIISLIILRHLLSMVDEKCRIGAQKISP